jgi:hypothetical protein
MLVDKVRRISVSGELFAPTIRMQLANAARAIAWAVAGMCVSVNSFVRFRSQAPGQFPVFAL